MKRLYLILFFTFIIVTDSIYCQYYNSELVITNETSTNMSIAVTIYPVSMIINGYNNYDLMAKTRQVNEYGHTTYYVNGVEHQGIDKVTTWVLLPQYRLDFDQDFYNYEGGEYENEPPTAYFNGKLGYGIYKVIIRTHIKGDEISTYPQHIDTFTIDKDLSNYLGDHWVRFRDNNNDPRTLFQYQDEREEQWIRINNTEYDHFRMEPWVHYGRDRQHGNPGPDYNQLEVSGQTIFPLDSRIDCNRYLPTTSTTTI